MSHAKPTRRSFGRLRRLPSGRWQAAYTGPDGLVHKAGATFEDEDSARAWLAAERRLVDLDAWTTPTERREAKRAASAAGGPTFATFAADWLAARRTARGPLKPRTRADYQRLLDRHLLPAFGRRKVRAITAADVTGWYQSLPEDTPTERAHAYQLLRAIMTTAADPKHRLIAENPCQVDGGGRTPRAHRVDVATLEELATMAAAMPERLRLAVLLGAWCQLRYGEIAELRRKDVNLTRGTVRVARGVTWPAGVPTVGSTKTEAGDRLVTIPPHLVPMVKDHLRQHTDTDRDALLFPAASGGHLHPRTFGKAFDRARAAAGRPDLHFHDLRHTGATLTAQAGATIAELMARLGHSTPNAAMRYQHAGRDRDRALAEALSRMATDGH